jgi:hypothetical protein
MSVATGHEVPLPPPEKPEREPERQPVREKLGVGVSDGSIWIADLRRRVREVSARNGGADVTVTATLADGMRLDLTDVAAGPGVAFVTLVSADPRRELAVRLEDLQRVELTATSAGGTTFRIRAGDIGFAPPPAA